MIGFRLTMQVQDKAVRAALERLSKVGRSLRRPLGRIGLFVRREAQRALRSRTRDWGPPTGRLAQSLAMRLDDISVEVGSDLVYAAIQQLGGTVTPKGHRYLAIPVLGHLRRGAVWPRDLPRGSMRFEPRASIRIGSHAWIGPALVRAADQEVGGPWQGAGKKPRREGHVRPASEVMFALVKRVTIRGRPYLTFSDAARAFAIGELEREYRAAWGGKG